MNSIFKDRFTWVLDAALVPNDPCAYGVVWDNILQCPVTNFQQHDDDFHTLFIMLHSHSEPKESCQIEIEANNKAGINGERLTWNQIRELYGANDLEDSP